jgi:hypothetical protein
MPGARWSRRVIEACTERLGYKGVAFALALALWVAASGEEPAARYVTVRFSPVLDSSEHLVDPPPPVQALVEGPARELLKLYATPPVLRRTYVSDGGATLHVDLRASDVELPSGVSRLRVRDVRPRRLDLPLARQRPVATRAALVPAPNDSQRRVRFDSVRVPSTRAEP